MKPHPFYTPENINRPAFSLKYAWTGWPSKTLFPPMLDTPQFSELDSRWENDGLKRLETNWSPNGITILFSVKPDIAPIRFTSLVKGRLQHAMRTEGTAVSFSRKVSFRSIGENKRLDVENYIKKQVSKEQFVDKNFAFRLKEFTRIDPLVKLKEPTRTNSGVYWYNLHVVLVTYKRNKIVGQELLSRIDNSLDRIADKNGSQLSVRSLMPDHLHLALRGDIGLSPEDIALSFMNNTSYSAGRKPIWQPGYYVGSFSEYDLGVNRS